MQPLHAHSRCEAGLYLKVVACDNCSQGPFAPEQTIFESTDVWEVLARCAHCQAQREFIFAWPAPEAAGMVHSDMQRGFIRAEVYSVDELAQYGGEKALREAGKMRVEGKSYVVQDGDVCHILFNV